MIDIQELRTLCVSDYDVIAARYGVRWNTSGRYGYKDNGANVLAVAHLDTVWGDSDLLPYFHADDKRVYSPYLDDRLGAYYILALLPSIGITMDWLLTLDEEIGQTTAENWQRDQRGAKAYHWMVEFDRSGTVPVTYEFGSADWHRAIAKAAKINPAQIQRGSFSDIATLTDIGCRGVNWGAGYAGAHHLTCHAALADIQTVVASFKRFWKAQKDKRWAYRPPVVHVPATRTYDALYGRYNSSAYARAGALESELCDWCGRLFTPKDGDDSYLCDACVKLLEGSSSAQVYTCAACGGSFDQHDISPHGLCWDCEYEENAK